MYYENKRTFYIKQYGPAVAVIIISIALIVTGLVIGFTPENKVASVTPVEKDAYTYTKQAIKGTVKEVNGITVTLVSNGEEHEINLIGIESTKNTEVLTKRMATDLTGKNVVVDFDTVKSEKGKTYGYLYIDNDFYNETLLENGLANLRAERNNINKLDVLAKAQISARNQGLGIWN
ncbi:MAG: thermonuclease family protein [Clostridia bacterium]|nr:thermonuclease family protein [Clostridia bacterium]MBR6640652.1 thermonuclease family protein [Clostridia bacterium]